MTVEFTLTRLQVEHVLDLADLPGARVYEGNPFNENCLTISLDLLSDAFRLIGVLSQGLGREGQEMVREVRYYESRVFDEGAVGFVLYWPGVIMVELV
jgi:hypothetical protein